MCFSLHTHFKAIIKWKTLNLLRFWKSTWISKDSHITNHSQNLRNSSGMKEMKRTESIKPSRWTRIFPLRNAKVDEKIRCSSLCQETIWNGHQTTFISMEHPSWINSNLVSSLKICHFIHLLGTLISVRLSTRMFHYTSIYV